MFCCVSIQKAATECVFEWQEMQKLWISRPHIECYVINEYLETFSYVPHHLVLSACLKLKLCRSFVRKVKTNLFFRNLTDPSGLGPPHFRCFTVTLRHTIFGRTPRDQ